MRRELRFMRRFAGVLLPDFASAVLSSTFFLADNPDRWSFHPRNGFELDFLECARCVNSFEGLTVGDQMGAAYQRCGHLPGAKKSVKDLHLFVALSALSF